MATFARTLILLLILAGAGQAQAAGSASAAGFRLWAELTPAEQLALAPIASDWNHLPAHQQERLIKVARGYPKLTPKQQQVLQARLVSWARMTPEQRKVARENYKQLLALPAPKQVQVKQRWSEARGAQPHAGEPSSSQ